MFPPFRVLNRVRNRTVRRAAFAMSLACGTSLVVMFGISRERDARATARLYIAAEQLESLTDGTPMDNPVRAAIVWGYVERLRHGLESPFRLIEAAARDPRLPIDERRTVAWALLAHVLRGEAHAVDPAALDGLGPSEGANITAGERHLALIRDFIVRAHNPRAAELAVRYAYTLAVAERIVDASGPVITAEAAAILGDGELARREARDVMRSANGSDPIDVVSRRRANRSFYVERPALLAPDNEMEDAAIEMAAQLLDSLRTLRPSARTSTDTAPPRARETGESSPVLARRLSLAAAKVPPAAPLLVTARRYRALVRTQAPAVDDDALARASNTEMLVAAIHVAPAAKSSRPQQRVIARLVLAAGVSMRSMSQDQVWQPADSTPTSTQVGTRLGLAGITFDADVPSAWRPFFLHSFAAGIHDIRRVLPELRLDAVNVRFRMDAPADSALAMHDPRTRTLHLPVLTAGGTLSHELAHDLDRFSAQQQGLAGYRSDIVARVGMKDVGRKGSGNGRLAASLRALTEELSELPRGAGAGPDRPAEIFATRVEWFVAKALARQGISSGFLSAVQDELLTGHVVHPERLRTSGRSRSLLNALEEMTTVAPFAAEDEEPSAYGLLRWSLAAPVDRRMAAEIVGGARRTWLPERLIGGGTCDAVTGRIALIRMAAESRARGWLRVRARWIADTARPAWARSVLHQVPWSRDLAERRVGELREYILVELASSGDLPTGLSAHAEPLAKQARCG